MKANKKLVELVKAELGLSTAKATETVKAVLEGVQTITKEDGKLTLAEYGTFSMKHRDARMGRNPKTGAAVAIAASSTMVFKQSKTAK